MVAKSYQNLEQVGEPYESNGRMYVKVRTNSGALKQVRFYTEYEYKRMYPSEKITEKFKNHKQTLGFDNGYITIFKGNTYNHKEWFKASTARYSRYWGWYFVSTENLPKDLPEDVEAIRLPWELIAPNDEVLPEDQVKKIVEELIYDADPSEYVGEIGERLKLKLLVEQVRETEGYYGVSNMHTMRDEDGNVFMWATTAKYLEPEHWYTMTGTVKDHKMFRNTKQTWLTRCLSVKEVEE